MPAQAKEALAFAVLGFLSWHGLPGSVPAATGARRPRSSARSRPAAARSPCRRPLPWPRHRCAWSPGKRLGQRDHPGRNGAAGPLGRSAPAPRPTPGRSGTTAPRGARPVPAITRALILRWNGRAWARVASPRPHGAVSTSLSGVTSLSPLRCLGGGLVLQVGVLLPRRPGHPAADSALERHRVDHGCQPAPRRQLRHESHRRDRPVAVRRMGGRQLRDQAVESGRLPRLSRAGEPDPALERPRMAAGRQPKPRYPAGQQSERRERAVRRCRAGRGLVLPLCPRRAEATGAELERPDLAAGRASPGPGPAGDVFAPLNGLSAWSPSSAWAVGSRITSIQNDTLVLHWNGTRWTRVASPDPGGQGGSSLNAVSSFSRSGAWAVGSGGGVLILRWNGARWTRS